MRHLKLVLIGLALGFVLAPGLGHAGPYCPDRASPNCHCVEKPYPLCVEQLRINNPKYVHLKIYIWTEFWQLRQGSAQQEGKDSEQICVTRPKDSNTTTVSVQQCTGNWIRGAQCHGWNVFNLPEPSQQQFAACEDYADEAVDAGKSAIANKCGFSGGRWSTNRKEHYNWCANLADADRHFMDSETQARAQDLNGCIAKIKAQKVEVAKNFTGTWTVSMQPVGDFTFVLTQQGPAVNGQMVNADPLKNGTIQGSLEGDNQHVSFSYVQPQINAGGQGRFWMEVTKDKLGGRFFINGEQAVRLLDGTRK
jgi:hypothetical protein